MTWPNLNKGPRVRRRPAVPGMPELGELRIRSEGVAGLVCECGPVVFETLLMFVDVQVDVLGAADPVV